LLESYDPQGIIQNRIGHKFSFVQEERVGTFFAKLRQGNMVWWQAVDIRLLPPLKATIVKKQVSYDLVVENRSGQPQRLAIDHQDFQATLNLRSGETKKLELPINIFSKGTNSVDLVVGTYRQKVNYIDWNIDDRPDFFETKFIKLLQCPFDRYISTAISFATTRRSDFAAALAGDRQLVLSIDDGEY